MKGRRGKAGTGFGCKDTNQMFSVIVLCNKDKTRSLIESLGFLFPYYSAEYNACLYKHFPNAKVVVFSFMCKKKTLIILISNVVLNNAADRLIILEFLKNRFYLFFHIYSSTFRDGLQNE